MKCLFQTRATAFAATVALAFAIGFLESGCSRDDEAAPLAPDTSATNTGGPVVVQLTSDQLNAIKIGPAKDYNFPIEKTGIGTFDFQNNLYSDTALSTPVFSPEAGTISQMFVELGDQVQSNQPLYTVQIGSTNLIVRSPIAGQITAVNGSVGISVEPGTVPAPCSVADISTKWLLANVSESDLPLFHPGQLVKATVSAYPNQAFEGKVIKVYPDVDANTHRGTVRCQISDKKNALRAGMLAGFTIRVQKPIKSIAIPANGIVREGDGTMTAWVTTDRSHFTQRVVKIGLRENGMVQIIDGVQAGELVVTDGAIFLDNMLQAPADD